MKVSVSLMYFINLVKIQIIVALQVYQLKIIEFYQRDIQLIVLRIGLNVDFHKLELLIIPTQVF